MTQPVAPSGQDISTFDNDAQLESVHQNMVAAGVPVETRRIVDFWSFGGTENFILPGQEDVPADLKQYITYKKMTEADKVEFQTKTNRDVRVQNTTKDIKLNMNPAHERAELLRISIVGWNLYKQNHRGELVQLNYNEKDRAAFIRQADPYIIQELEKAIRAFNPWMRSEATPDEIRAEIASLQEQLVEAEQRELEK